MTLPSVKPLLEWRVESEIRDGIPLWAGEQETKDVTISEAKAALEKAKQEAREERERLVSELERIQNRLQEIDVELGEEAPAPPKRKYTRRVQG